MTTRPSPQSGDVLLGCVHKPNPYAAHIFQLLPGLQFRRPDGSTDTAKWIVLCNGCNTKYGERADKAPIGCDLIWRDDNEPFEYEKPS